MNELPDSPPATGIIAWFARNSVAANLLMLVILIGGLWSAIHIQRAMEPEFSFNRIQITMAYPGAAPEEVEQGIILKIEEALEDINAIKRIDATASDSLGTLILELHDGYEILATLDEVKSAVDAITNFPEDAEKPVINQLERQKFVVNVQVLGNLGERDRKELAEELKNDLLRSPDIANAVVYGTRDYEIAIEIPEATLRKYHLTLEQVSQAVRASSIDLPGGAIRSDTGNIMVRTKGQAYDQLDFEKIVLLTYPDGTRLTLGDIATIDDGFVEVDGFGLFDQKPSATISVYAVGEQDLIKVAEAVKQYVAEKRPQLPQGVSLEYWADASFYLESRLDMMIKNLALGALLVFIILGLFLDIKLAFWVMAGLPVCFLGTFALMANEPVNITLNMISLFGFILVLGIVVDDAIIIGESSYTSIEHFGHSTESVIHGTLKVATPATFGVLTTIVAFAPTLFTEGAFSPFPEAMGWVVILCLVFSLIESKWILPAHLAHSTPSDHGAWKKINSVQEKINNHLSAFVQEYYRPFMLRCIKHRYNTLAVFVGMLIIAGGLVAGGMVRFIVVPDVAGDYITSDVEMVEGTTDEQNRAAHDHVANALYSINERYKRDSGDEKGFIRHVLSRGENHRFSRFLIELTRVEERTIDAGEIMKQWREAVGDIPGSKVISFSNINNVAGAPVAIELIGPDMDMLGKAALDLADKLSSYDGLYDIDSGTTAVQDEIVLDIKPSAEALGLTLASVGSQVRQAFYGAEAQRIQRGSHEVKVMVRYPRDERRAVANLENMYIRTPDGKEVPFASVADMHVEPGYTKITRIDGQRSITVSAGANKHVVEPKAIVTDILDNYLPQLQRKYPGLRAELSGESEEEIKVLHSMMFGFIMALFGIYTLLAIPLKSYLQPIIIMSVIPFGIIGAIVGHILMDLPLSMMSLMGIIALSGVVVNDSLIMVDFINRAAERGEDRFTAVVESGTARFRAIMLTSLTTFFGLLPMLLEDTLQAQMMVPMATSLGFGIIFATVITLLLIPALYIILEDIGEAVGTKTRTRRLSTQP